MVHEVGRTPITDNELAQLIPSLSTKEELNEFEFENILQARSWALAEKQIKNCDPLTESYVRELHKRMFDQTWKWAGKYRTSQRNLGVPPHQILERLGVLLGDAKYWVEHGTYPHDEIAVRFHHGLVSIHPFSNGNGRHARLMADVIATRLRRPQFSWGSKNIVEAGPTRQVYIESLQAADNGDIAPLLDFSRS